MKTLLNKLITGVLATVLVFAGLPLSSAHAASLTDTATPPPAAVQDAKHSTERLEAAFARQTKMVERVGKLYAQADLGFPKIQGKIDKAKAKGLDVSAVQTAFEKQLLQLLRGSYSRSGPAREWFHTVDRQGLAERVWSLHIGA